jgi:lipid-binding SYLF domain-containing protein
MPPTRRVCLALLATCFVLSPMRRPARAASARQLRAEGEAALAKLYAAQPRLRSLGARARAILVFPRIVKVGVLLAGGQTGDGVLLVKGRPTGYFNLSAASFGPQAGGQTFSYVLFFMTPAALEYLNKSDGWAIGTGPSVVVIDEGAAAAIDTTTVGHDVYAVPFAQKGLMAGLDLAGSKITPIKPDA